MEINARQAVELLNKNGIEVSPATVVNWAKAQLIAGWQSVSNRWYFDSDSITHAIAAEWVPPRVGQKRRYSDKQREEMKELRANGATLDKIAKQYGCDQSFVSLLVRGLR